VVGEGERREREEEWMWERGEREGW
jgi:hypothetical protein